MFYMDDDVDDDELQALYNNGHWEWSDIAKELIFISDTDKSNEHFEPYTPAVFKHGPVEFRDDIDLMEQQRFRKRYQRKMEGENDVIFLQDIKDLVLFTAPSNILNLNVIKILHLPSSDRFIRALILYCQYYLQVSALMSNRLLETETKVRTNKSNEVELNYSENLEDLRLLVAKEYCTFLLGGKDYKQFHHMGSDQKSRSLSKKEAFIFESFISLSVQIIWLALGRKSFNQIEMEVHRMFKSQKFNIIEHRSNINTVSKMSPEEQYVLLGHCVQNKTKLHVMSPLLNECFCQRPIDFRLVGLGSVKFARLTSRQTYLAQILTANETTFKNKGLTLGILGLPRARFDTMLMEIKTVVSSSTNSRSRSLSRQSVMRKSRLAESTTSALHNKLYDDIVLPVNTIDKEWLPQSFPTETPATIRCNHTQRDKWIAWQHQQIKKRFHNKSRKR